MPIENLFIIAFVICFASFVQGFTGFGFAIITVPILSILIDIKHAVPLVAVCGFVINLYLFIHMRKEINFREVKNLIISGIVGIPLGSILVLLLHTFILKKILAIIVILFVFLSTFRIIKPKVLNSKWGYLFGFLSGILAGAFNTSGPPVLIYFYLQQADKLQQKASITGYFMISSIFVLIFHAVTGVSTIEIWIEAFKYLPLIIVGIVAGHFLFYKITTGFYNKLILLVLFAVGILLLTIS